jgi:hypothetical protein
MKRRLHIASAVLATLLIATFWTSTVLTELLAGHGTVATVKTLVLYGMALLLPAMATAGATGASLGRGWRLPEVARKSKRMKWIAANGLIVLLPSAVFLALRSADGRFDAVFYAVQGLELLAGATNLTLLALNMRDGIALGRRRSAVSRSR